MKRWDKTEIRRLRDLPVEEAARRLGLRVERRKALCPFHDDRHPSLTFSARTNTYRCFACGAQGDTIDLARHLLGANFSDACRWLADATGIIQSEHRPPPAPAAAPFDAARYAPRFEHPRLTPEARAFLFQERRIDPRVVRWCRLTSWTDRRGGQWLSIPYYDRHGTLTGIQNRNLIGGAQPRFRFPRGSRCGIYNLPVLSLLREGEPLYIAEGTSDCWALLSAGHKAVAIPSATLLARSDAELLRHVAGTLHTTFHMYPDRDPPGERLFRELHEALPAIVRHELPESCKDFSEYYLRER